MSKESLNISLPAKLMKRIDAAAEAKKISPNEYVTQVLLDKLGPEVILDDKTANQDVLPAEVKMYGDGGSRGNPGPSAGGFVVLDMQNNVLRESGKYLGIATNNYAEYHSLKGGLELCAAQGAAVVHVHMDSLLVINQMKGIYKVRHETLIPIHMAIKDLLPSFKHVNFTHVPRELNKLADAEVNKTLDALKE